MNDVAELKQFAALHAKAQNIPRYRDLLARITSDEEAAPGSWAVEWSRAGEELLAAGRPLEASRHFALARFPYVDGPTRRVAAENCVNAFDLWRKESSSLQRLEIEVPGGSGADGGRVVCWTAGLSASDPRPLLLLTGGIVSVKEQWAPVLELVGRFGMAGVATELPGVGENSLVYGPDSWRMLSAVLDAVADQADVNQTYAVAHSFSGHLALRCAAGDPRIRGVVTTGAPVGAFFTDRAWQAAIPRITADTLLHLAGAPGGDLARLLRPLALTADELGAVRVPVAYLRSTRDEIIPAMEPALLAEHLRDLRVEEIDDVHGSPRHVAESRLWTVVSVLRMRGVRTTQARVVSALWHLLRTRRRLIGG